MVYLTETTTTELTVLTSHHVTKWWQRVRISIAVKYRLPTHTSVIPAAVLTSTWTSSMSVTAEVGLVILAVHNVLIVCIL